MKREIANILNQMIAILLGSVWLLGCQQVKNRSGTDSGISGDFEITDDAIENSISSEFLIQKGVDPDDITVLSEEGVVTLSGELQTILEEDRAIAITKRIKGVRSVIDQLSVVKTDISDQKISDNIEKALLTDPATESFDILTVVKNGEVTLSGTVDSWQEKQLAALIVKNVSGIRSVENNITFYYTENREDADIRADIEQTLKWDVLVDDAMIEVEVHDQNVHLKGIVGSAAEKSEALVDAWVAGVNYVDASQLEVQKWAREDDLRADKYAVKPDAEIREAILDAFIFDPRIVSFNPDVSVADGEVNLSGVVSNLKAKKAAEIDAKNVVGVKSVTNNIEVKGNEALSDEMISRQIETILSWNSNVEGNEVDVTVVNGIVYLTGTVDDYFEKYKAEDLLSSLRGVTSVDNGLTVPTEIAPPYVHDYTFDLYQPYNPDIDMTPVTNDEKIVNNIHEQIWWSPYVNASDVNISVESGVATLSGTVDSWREYYSAESNAYDGGALAVDNNLIISYN